MSKRNIKILDIGVIRKTIVKPLEKSAAFLQKTVLKHIKAYKKSKAIIFNKLLKIFSIVGNSKQYLYKKNTEYSFSDSRLFLLKEIKLKEDFSNKKALRFHFSGMKNNIYSFVVIFFIALCFSGCEKDDICPEGSNTTPSLIIRFYDVTNPNTDESLDVTNLVVQGVGNDSVLSGYDIVATDSIALPLKTTDNITQYSLYQEYVLNDNDTPDDDSDDYVTGNEDIITITYDVEEVYVSRACGYKTVYKNVSINLESDSDNWIQLIRSVNDNQSVEDETEQHFKFYH